VINNSGPVYEFNGFVLDNTLEGMLLYHLFGLLWTITLIIAISRTTIAGAIASWYWVRIKSKMPFFTVLSAFYRTMKYSLGSLALGSFLIAVIEFLRIILAYYAAKLKGSQNNCLKFMICIVNCCLKCFEDFLQFITKNAYIQIAIYGLSFWQATRKASQLLARNIDYVFAVQYVGDYLFFLGKLFVVMSTTLIGYFIINTQNDNTNLNFDITPVVLIFIISWGIAGVFFAVYEYAVNTLLISFCEDLERNDGSEEKPYYMSDGLRQYVNVNSIKKV